MKEKRDKLWGEITVRVLSSDAGHKVEVRDTGVGMSKSFLPAHFSTSARAITTLR